MKPLPVRSNPSFRGFSLVEMLFAIFVLGIGVISIASLFPVGLTQQRRSADDILGPTIANNALELIRSRVSPDDFGMFLDGQYRPLVDPELPTIQGDTRWRRPAFHANAANSVSGKPITPGSIDLFYGSQHGGATADTTTEIFYNPLKWGAVPPQVVITQEERYYPMWTPGQVGGPQYVWECAFRRFQGRVLVAVFVYRVHRSGGESGPYVVAQNPIAPNAPWLPHFNQFDGTGTGMDNPWSIDFNGDNTPGTSGDEFVANTGPGTVFDPTNYDHGWQGPGQWVLDNNNNVHRVVSGRRSIGDGPVELSRAPVPMPFIPVYSFAGNATLPVVQVMYIPPNDPNGWTLTPVYVMVREL